MTARITQQQLESYLWGAATLLRGTIDAGDYEQFIFPLLFYKRLCDVFDEETQTALAESGGVQNPHYQILLIGDTYVSPMHDLNFLVTNLFFAPQRSPMLALRTLPSRSSQN